MGVNKMTIYEKRINNNKWQLVCDMWETSRAWGHKVNLIKNGYDYGEHKVRYYNRTWERYEYETCMSDAVATLYEKELNQFINRWKEKNNVIRFKKGQKSEVINLFNQEEIAQDLKTLKAVIRDRDFDSKGY